MSNQPQRYSVEDLKYLMARLRDPESGCPWDKVQTFATIVPYTLEEAYEVADAIEREDWPHLQDELGDLLFQVIYYAQMAQEQTWFELEDVVHGLVTKMVRRHPHVFADGKLYAANNTASSTEVSQQQVKQRWDEIKAQEKAEVKQSTEPLSILADIPVGLPALTRAAKIQKRASKVGFDWPDISGVLDKIREELDEVQEAVDAGNLSAAQEEYGDLLFAVTNLTRFLKQDPETALRGTNRKFERRFAYIEQQLHQAGLSFDQVDLAQMDHWWDEAKKLEY
ncbi:ATP diphosphatase [Oceanospirillum multiglobuliferum]|uniref:Nucleoside triphosphate pyrophosphohydrolase n=1 Tax=Oceanospirillum multiglobuliferum TaxID=64969 RepID=A0A1T4N5K1_9GAMM|nr:nucleoside triphosphate pyrophosphohydrolase [Oceanospirillum multiglobuliferum]OPX55846.1 nucleoside triphosphate pyrophosphohydrolase [Oceanospirillum multiglobuliferum]SJZ74522.1 ATP diphosphatase [Oceanospirillum multiglobuliferum]